MKYWDKAWTLVEGCTPCPPGCEKEWFLRGFQEAMRVISDQVKKVSPPSILIDKEVYKPLRWRTGPVPEGEVVLYEYFLDGLGTDYEIGEGNASGDLIGNFHTEWKNARWLPLSEILALVENPQGGEG